MRGLADRCGPGAGSAGGGLVSDAGGRVAGDGGTRACPFREEVAASGEPTAESAWRVRSDCVADDDGVVGRHLSDDDDVDDDDGDQDGR